MDHATSMTINGGMFAASPRTAYAQERPLMWMRWLGVARIGALSLVAVGAAFVDVRVGRGFLLAIFVLGFVSGLWHLRSLQYRSLLTRGELWAQVIVDFLVVGSTIVCTAGPGSYFTFMLIVVVLESGLLLGFTQGFVVAAIASALMLQQTTFTDYEVHQLETFELWHGFLVQCLAMFLTAFISGFWNGRINRLQAYQRDILDNMNSGFLITDATGVIVVQNEAAKQILEMETDTSVGQPVAEVLRVDSGAECPIQTALRSGEDFVSYEFLATTDRGSTRLLGLTTNCVTDSHGEITGVIASFTDLTEMNEMREELRRQDRMAVIGELAAGLAHEIRNPVAVIRGAIDEMNATMEYEGLQQRLFDMAIREVDHLNEIVSGFLDFAREPSVRRESFDLRGLAEEVVALLEREAVPGSRVDLQLILPDTACVVSGDRSQLKQVFMNLGKNAIEAMEGKGRLRIRLSNEDGPVEARFEDEGPGVGPDKVAKIFEPFYSTKSSGVGMGLAVCLRIITGHDGTIHPSAREGGGCAMRVLLPAVTL